MNIYFKEREKLTILKKYLNCFIPIFSHAKLRETGNWVNLAVSMIVILRIN